MDGGKGLPVSVQISSEHLVIKGITAAIGELSIELEELLYDSSIKKVFCDSKASHDHRILGLIDHWNSVSVVNFKDMADELVGLSNVCRGLAKLVTMAMPEIGRRFVKDQAGWVYWESVGRRVSSIEQGAARALGVRRDGRLAHAEGI
jgi:hypothetical protein